MQDRPDGHALDDKVEEYDDRKPVKNLSELTENFPHLFSSIGKDNTARNKKACRVPK